MGRFHDVVLAVGQLRADPTLCLIKAGIWRRRIFGGAFFVIKNLTHRPPDKTNQSMAIEKKEIPGKRVETRRCMIAAVVYGKFNSFISIHEKVYFFPEAKMSKQILSCQDSENGEAALALMEYLVFYGGPAERPVIRVRGHEKQGLRLLSIKTFQE